jgi:hypothetical protein
MQAGRLHSLQLFPLIRPLISADGPADKTRSSADSADVSYSFYYPSLPAN